MDAYHVALFIHLMSLVAAACASAIVHFAVHRRGHAAAVGEALQWHAFAGATARVFPIAVLTLVATGSWMAAITGNALWHAGWLQAGLLGAVLLMASGATIGRRARAAAAGMLSVLRGESSTPLATLARDPLADTMIWANSGLALGVVFVMTLKPALGGSLTVLAIGALIGTLVARAPSRAAMPAAEASA